MRILSDTPAVMRPDAKTNIRGVTAASGTHKKGRKSLKLPGFLPGGQFGLLQSCRKTLLLVESRGWGLVLVTQPPLALGEEFGGL